MTATTLDVVWSRAWVLDRLEPDLTAGRPRSTDVAEVLEAVERLRAVTQERHLDAAEAVGRPRPHPTMALCRVWDVAIANATAWSTATGFPAKTSGAQTSGASTVPWCWTHERDVTHCHRAGEACTGERIQTTDRVGDRLGVDPSAMVLARITSRLDAAAHHLAALAVAVAEGDHRARTTHARLAHGALVALADLVVEGAGLRKVNVAAELAAEVNCWNHQRHALWAAPSRTTDGMFVCDWCGKMRRLTGQWPHHEWIQDVADGKTGLAKQHISTAKARTETEATTQARLAALAPTTTAPPCEDYLCRSSTPPTCPAWCATTPTGTPISTRASTTWPTRTRTGTGRPRSSGPGPTATHPVQISPRSCATTGPSSTSSTRSTTCRTPSRPYSTAFSRGSRITPAEVSYEVDPLYIDEDPS